MAKTILFAANRGYALTSSRDAIIQHFLDLGWRVVLATSDDIYARQLVVSGAVLEPVNINRGGLAPGSDWQVWHRMLAINRRWRPTLVHHFHAKPVILGNMATRCVKVKGRCIVNTITGLGHAFIASRATARLVGLGYMVALSRSDVTIFQNRDDLKLFLERGWVSKDCARLIAGSGVDLSRFGYIDRSGRMETAPVVVMLGRLLHQKGIPEFVEVARRIRHNMPAARFIIAGEEDLIHPDAVTVDWIREQEGVEYLGHLQDVGPILEKADLLLYPSYYREGVPRVVLEAAATGLPAVAFDVPGVREAVRNGETGFLVFDRDVDNMTRRVRELLEDETLRLRMGQKARIMVEKYFDVKEIQRQYLDVYRELGFDV